MNDEGSTQRRRGDDSNQSWRPVPDPTVLTTEQLLREIATLREYIEAVTEGQNRVIDERFNAVDKEFVLIERQRVEQKADTKEALAAALQAAKEAVQEQTLASEKAISKSEDTTAKEIDGLKTQYEKAFEAQLRSSDELKERIAANELQIAAPREQSVGIQFQKRESGTSIDRWVAIMAVFVALIIGVSGAIIVAVSNSSNNSRIITVTRSTP
jgi:hypothetical protein